MNMVLTFLMKHWQRLPLEGLKIPSHLSSVVATPRFRASSHVIFFILANGLSDPILVIKIPRLPGDTSHLDREAANLRAVHATRIGGFNSIPRVVAYEDYEDSRLLVETALVGQTMSPALVRRQPQTCIEAGLTWLIDLHLATAKPCEDTREWFERLVESPLDRFKSVFPLFATEQCLIDQTYELLLPLCNRDIPLVFEHGDLSAPNILISKRGNLGVVDWELAESSGLPTIDFFFFLTYIAFARRRARKHRDYLAAFHEAFFGPTAWAWPYVVRYAERLRLPLEVLRPLFILCWSRYVTNIVMRLNDLNSSQGALENETVAWLRSNRYYTLWCHTVDHVQELSLIN